MTVLYIRPANKQISSNTRSNSKSPPKQSKGKPLTCIVSNFTLPKFHLLATFKLKKVKAGSRDGAVVRALASHQCGSGSIPRLDTVCGLSLLLVHFSAPRSFSPGTPIFPSPPKPKVSKFQFDLDFSG